MSHIRWPEAVEFKLITLEPEAEERVCAHCGGFTYVYDHRERDLHSLDGPMHVVSKVVCCPDPGCAGHAEKRESPAAMGLAPPYWSVSWDVFAWMGHRRFARHWSVPQIRAELLDRYRIAVSADLIEDYTAKYEVMVAARESDLARLVTEYRDVEDVILSIDGLQPEKGHETLYVVRELRAKRVWFAEPLLSSAAGEVKRLFERARDLAARIGKPVRGWMSDKQDAFVSGVKAVFPRVPHRYCANHFLRDAAKPVLEADSHAKVQMRRKVRGLREIERRMLAERTEPAATSPAPPPPLQEPTPPPLQEPTPPPLQEPTPPPLQEPTPPPPAASPQPPAASPPPPAASPQPPAASPPTTTPAPLTPQPEPHRISEAGQVVLDYCAAVRGILNDDQGGPLHPPGVRMAEALAEIHDSIGRAQVEKKGGLANAR